MLHTGTGVNPAVNDKVILATPDKGKPSAFGFGGFSLERGVLEPNYEFKGGYTWYKANFDTGTGNGSALLIDNTGVIIEIVNC